MRDQHGGAAIVDEVPPKVRADRHSRAGIQRGEWLVEQQQARLRDQCPGQRHALGLPAGQTPRPTRCELAEADPIEPIAGCSASLSTVGTARAKTERDVVERTQVREEQVVLEHHGDRPAFRRDVRPPRWIIEHPPVEPDGTGAEGSQAGECPQGGGLASTVRTEERHHLAGTGLEIELERERALRDADDRTQAQLGHVEVPVIHRSRRLARTAMDTTRSTRDSAIAAGGSVSSAR